MNAPKTDLFVAGINLSKDNVLVDHAGFAVEGDTLMANHAQAHTPFGTASEANSLPVAGRMGEFDHLMKEGTGPTRWIPGSNCGAAAEIFAFDGHAMRPGTHDGMKLPPSSRVGVGDEGICTAYANVIETVLRSFRFYLGDLPEKSGAQMKQALTGRLIAAFCERIAGLADATGNKENKATLLASVSQMDTDATSESTIPQDVAGSGAECIGAKLAPNSIGINAFARSLKSSPHRALHEKVGAVRAILKRVPLIRTFKAAVAAKRHDLELARNLGCVRATEPGSVDEITDRVRFGGLQRLR